MNSVEMLATPPKTLLITGQGYGSVVEMAGVGVSTQCNSLGPMRWHHWLASSERQHSSKNGGSQDSGRTPPAPPVCLLHTKSSLLSHCSSEPFFLSFSFSLSLSLFQLTIHMSLMPTSSFLLIENVVGPSLCLHDEFLRELRVGPHHCHANPFYQRAGASGSLTGQGVLRRSRRKTFTDVKSTASPVFLALQEGEAKGQALWWSRGAVRELGWEQAGNPVSRHKPLQSVLLVFKGCNGAWKGGQVRLALSISQGADDCGVSAWEPSFEKWVLDFFPK